MTLGPLSLGEADWELGRPPGRQAETRAQDNGKSQQEAKERGKPGSGGSDRRTPSWTPHSRDWPRTPGKALPLPPYTTFPSHTGDTALAPPHAPIPADPSTQRLTGMGLG